MTNIELRKVSADDDNPRRIECLIDNELFGIVDCDGMISTRGKIPPYEWEVLTSVSKNFLLFYYNIK